LRGLIGPREATRIWDRHILNCAVVAELVPSQASVCDLGSGAGLPGIPIALARPDLSVTLLEPLLRRATYLGEVVAALELRNVDVLRCRAEEVGGARSWDYVTARAVAPLERLAGWAAPLLAEGGTLLALKGESARDELAAALPKLRRLGATDSQVVDAEAASGAGTTTVVQVRFAGAPKRARAGVRGRRQGSPRKDGR
jgi:16S rRNA (guanine527-N7)-methyltransferase